MSRVNWQRTKISRVLCWGEIESIIVTSFEEGLPDFQDTGDVPVWDVVEKICNEIRDLAVQRTGSGQ